MTNLLNTLPQFSEHDMLVYDQRRATIQHNIADMSIPTAHTECCHVNESCRLAAGIYSILAMYSFRPPLKLYGDLAKRLRETMVLEDAVYFWGPESEFLLWMLFVGGYAALGREERGWFAEMVWFVVRKREFKGWKEVSMLLEAMPVHYLLWGPFEVLYHEATEFLGEVGGS
jgi:hypothetical protein